jgi:hypothetical protein
VAARTPDDERLALGLPVLIEDWFIPRGRMFLLGDKILLHPSDMMALRHGGRTPLWTRHMLGVREAERDRRKRSKVPPTCHVICDARIP